MNLKVTIQNIKAIDNLTLELPVEKGLYAITGENATGKSTITMCAASLFYHFNAKQYFGEVSPNSSVSFELNNNTQSYSYDKNGRAIKTGNITIKGFFEGSLIFGNRFRNTSYGALKKLDSISDDDIEPAENFIRENLGLILCNDKSYYKDLYRLKRGLQNKYKLGGVPFFYLRNGTRVNQAHMSTGENLLLSILHSISLRIEERGRLDIPCMIFLDEIELALHASSLRRLVVLLNEIANNYNMAIYFSTHSIELIRDIPPERIYYIQKYIDGSIDILNPCYPAFATKNLYDSNMGYDDVILVEDDLARAIIQDLLRRYSLLGNRLVSVLPCGGWQNVLRLASDILQSNLLGQKSKIIVILDGDIRESVSSFLTQNNINLNIPLNYLPIPSLEKFLKVNLYDKVDKKMTQEFDNYIFQKVGLNHILLNYKNDGPHKKDDANGKILYEKYLLPEMSSNGRSREYLIDIVIRFMIENNNKNLPKILTFLQKQL